MSLLSDYVQACCGYDDAGHPAAETQFTFGMSPFAVSDGENVEDFTEITAAAQTDAIVNIEIVDNIAKVEFDFALDIDTFVELIDELDFYKDQLAHVNDTLAGYEAMFNRAVDEDDEEALEDVDIKFRSTSVPFMIPTIVPNAFAGDVHVSFSEDPKFFFLTSDKPNQMPTKLVMIFDAHALFAEDESAIYDFDAEEEIRMQQEEMYLAEEARKAEEAAYQSQYGFSNDPYEDDDDDDNDPRLKGVRIK